jgi:hypothetical protein
VGVVKLLVIQALGQTVFYNHCLGFFCFCFCLCLNNSFSPIALKTIVLQNPQLQRTASGFLYRSTRLANVNAAYVNAAYVNAAYVNAAYVNAPCLKLRRLLERNRPTGAGFSFALAQRRWRTRRQARWSVSRQKSRKPGAHRSKDPEFEANNRYASSGSGGCCIGQIGHS